MQLANNIKKWIITKLGGHPEIPHIETPIITYDHYENDQITAVFRSNSLYDIDDEYIKDQLIHKIAAEILERNLATIEQQNIVMPDGRYVETRANIYVLRERGKSNENFM